MLFFDQSEEWSLLNFIKYLDSIESLRDSSEPHRKYGIILNGIKNDENESQKKRERAEQALEKYLVESDNPAIELDEASDILVLGKRDNLRRLKSDLGTKSPMMISCLPVNQSEKKPLSLSKKNKESVGSTKKAKTTKDTLSSSHGVPKPSSSAGVTKPFSSSLESAINSPEPRTPPHRIFSYGTSSGSSVCKEHGSKDDTSEDDLLMKSPVDITVDCKLIVKNMCVRSKMEQWRRSSRYVEEIHKQDLMRYNILDTAKSSATEARNLFRRHWDDIIGTIEEFLTILKNVNTAEKLRDIIRIECEKLRENGNTIWRKRVLDLIEIFWKQFSNGRNHLKENQTEGHYIIKFVSHIFTMLFEDQLFLDCRWGESTLQCSADQLNQSLRDDDR
ncbi:hypothetical protein GLOIN_2v1785866 [Rhizophagus irregularis DAOM 181602=DAOM 197198]|nr:hypothetical protein GLOIN_2v1785866 [Rhizophagus irregularis DAOM 181602=DAOM 197198]